MRIAEPERKEFFESTSPADKRIVVRNEIIRRLGVWGFDDWWMTELAAPAIDINPEDARKETLLQNLRWALIIIAVGKVEKSVPGVEKHSSAIMPDAVGGLIDEDRFGIGYRSSV